MSRMNTKSGTVAEEAKGKRFGPPARTWPAAVAIFCGLCFAPAAPAATATVTQTLNLQLNAAVTVTVPASATLTNTGTVFNPYGNSMTVQYQVRSTPGTSGGSITVQATAEFAPAGGPTVASGNLKYTCSGQRWGRRAAERRPSA